MLRKLMKHELRATGRVMGPMLALVLATAVGGNISVHKLLETDNSFMNPLGVLLLTAFVLAIMAACVASFALMIERFHKNLLRDEGYLMMTLPATVHEHVLSKLLVSLIWFAATAVVMLLAVGILVFDLWIAREVIWEIAAILPELRLGDLKLSEIVPDLLGYGVELIVLMIVTGSCVCLQMYAAMAAGHSFTHHKGLLSVAAFFVFAILWSVIQNGAALLLNLLDWEGLSLWLANLPQAVQMHAMLLGGTALMLIPAAMWYAVTVYFLKNRLNLD